MKALYVLLAFIYVHNVNGNNYSYYEGVDKYYKLHLEKKSWYEAVKRCEFENAKLAMPRNQAEAAILIDLLSGLEDFEMLLGFHDIFSEAEFVSLDGIPLQYYFKKWRKDEPNNDKNTEHCVVIHKEGLLNDVPCGTSRTFPFLCEKNGRRNDFPRDVDICLYTDSQYVCPEHLDYCYKLHLNPKRWAMAKQICEYEHATLAMIYSKAEEEFLANSLRNIDGKQSGFALLGFHDLFKEKEFITLKGEQLDNLSYIHWAAGEPSVGGNEHCGAMSKSGELMDVSCERIDIFFCQRPNNYNKSKFELFK